MFDFYGVFFLFVLTSFRSVTQMRGPKTGQDEKKKEEAEADEKI